MRLSALLLVALMAGPGFGSPDSEADTEDIEATIVHAYVEGIWRDRVAAKVREGFHPGFVIHILREGKLINRDLEPWLKRVGMNGDGNPNIRCDLQVLDQTGDAAVAKAEVYEGDRLRYTDYFGLYRFPEGWKIVSKIYHSH